MEGIFQDYKHYVKWIEDNYESTSRELTVLLKKMDY